ncbi:hypothetical protein [Massilia glaciei]|uniref:hypothetical protein n=1 Tax=Massilia glaciei TaxID=1524097 RepID=UPI0015E7EF4F|nr:hypothetical protein [Massilia glaciei]
MPAACSSSSWRWPRPSTSGRGRRRRPADPDDTLPARIALLEAQVAAAARPDAAVAAYAGARQALATLLKQSESDPLDVYLQRGSAVAWQKVGELGLQAVDKGSACAYLDLAEARYAGFAAGGRLNAADAVARAKLGESRRRCGAPAAAPAPATAPATAATKATAPATGPATAKVP